MRSLAFGAALLAAWASTAAARADLTYQYFTEASSYTAVTGAPLTVNLYLRETATNGSASLILGNGGLAGAGVYVTQSGVVPANATTISAVNDQTGTGGNFAGGFASAKFDATRARLLETTSFSAAGGPLGTAVTVGDTTTRSVFLGSLTLTAGAQDTTTTFTVQTYRNAPTGTFGGNGVNSNTLTFNNPPFDLDVTNNAELGSPSAVYTGANDLPFNTFTVVAVPEPGSTALALLAAAAAGAGVWRRRKKRRGPRPAP